MNTRRYIPAGVDAIFSILDRMAKCDSNKPENLDIVNRVLSGELNKESLLQRVIDRVERELLGEAGEEADGDEEETEEIGDEDEDEDEIVRVLNLSNNLLQRLPEFVCGMKNLEVLNLSSNSLQSLPETFGDLINLELDLSCNQIHALPNSFCKLKKLRKLNLDQNPIVIPPIKAVNDGVQAVQICMAQLRLAD